jgi:hypothetical protein
MKAEDIVVGGIYYITPNGDKYDGRRVRVTSIVNDTANLVFLTGDPGAEDSFEFRWLAPPSALEQLAESAE